MEELKIIDSIDPTGLRSYRESHEAFQEYPVGVPL
jgi:hypothetical protein